MHSFPRRHALALSLAGALACMSPAIAQQVVADGDVPGEDFKMPAAGDYATADPDQPVFHAINGGQIIGAVGTNLSTTGDNAAGVRVEGVGSNISLDRNSSILTTGRGAAGVAVTGGAFDGWGVGVETRGEHASGLQVAGGNAALARSTVQTFGQEAHGVEATAGEFIGDATHIRTGGHGAYGAYLRDGELLMENGSVIETSGREAHGIVADGTSHIMLGQTDVMAHGEAAWGAVIGDDSQLQLDGSMVYSAQHGGVRVRGSGSSGLRLDNGSFLYGGNGTALALDASVAGRFDVELNSSEIFGDIVINPDDLAAGLTPASDLHVRLSGGSTWTGSSDIINSMVLEGTSWWSLRGDAQVGSLEVRNSVVSLSGGAGGAFNTLTVDGNLHSENAQFQFSGVLEGDTAAFDRLHVRGDSSGDAAIWVTNVGGLGSGTIEGIPLIQVDGASLADYSLVGRVVAGSNEYFLHKGGVAGGEGNWYLRSLLPPADPCDADPSLPGCAPIDPVDPVDPIDPITPPPVLRPEAGVYLANQSVALGMFSHRLGDRLGSVDTGEARNAWARVGRSQADSTAVGGQLSVDGDTSALQIGSDLVRGGNAVFGVMLGSGRSDSTVVSGLTGYSAKGRVRGSAVGVYGTFRQQPGSLTGAYLDASVQMGRFDNRVQGIGLAPEHYDSRMSTASLESGYTFNVWQGAASTLYVQPQLQLSHVDFRADRHVESNGTVIDHADAGGLSGRLGVRVFGHGTVAGNTVQPYLGVNWLRGSGTSTLQFNGDTLGADVPRNRYEVQAGAELKLGQRWGAWGGMSVQRGDRGYRNVGGQLGLRMGW